MSIHAVFCAHDRPGNYAGGPNAWLQRLLPDLRNSGIFITTLVIGAGPEEACPLVSELHHQKISVRFLDYATPNRLYLQQQIRWLAKQLNDLRPDVLVPNLMIPAYFAARWARRAGIPSIGVVHSNDKFYHHLLDVFVYGSSRWRIDSVVAVSKHLENLISERNKHGVFMERIPYGVHVPPQLPRPNSQGLRISYVGRFRQEQKRVLDIAKSFCAASKKLPTAKFTLLGNGPEKDLMARIVDQFGAANSVFISNPLPPSKIQPFMQSQDILVLLSEYEGLPIALQEAMATGMVPVCLSEVSGTNELLQNGRNGLIVVDREKDFISALCKLDEDRVLLKRLSENARRSISLNYCSTDQHEKWATLIKQHASRIKKRRRIRLPLLLGLPSTHPSFGGEDRVSPSLLSKTKQQLKKSLFSIRLAIRPRSRLRSIWQAFRN